MWAGSVELGGLVQGGGRMKRSTDNRRSPRKYGIRGDADGSGEAEQVQEE